jgi:CheY-like chemotaxis protein
MPDKSVDMLLLEPVTLLRRTVCLTARSLALGEVHEAASDATAQRLLYGKPFHGAVFASANLPAGDAVHPGLALLDLVRNGYSASRRDIPIAVMLDHVTPDLLDALRLRQVSRVIVKPFRARDLLDTFAEFAAIRRGA